MILTVDDATGLPEPAHVAPVPDTTDQPGPVDAVTFEGLIEMMQTPKTAREGEALLMQALGRCEFETVKRTISALSSLKRRRWQKGNRR